MYRNEGGWRFTDVTSQAGVGDTGFGLGVAVADYDNDGDPDIYLNNDGPNVLYRNNGDGVSAHVRVYAVGLMLLDEVHSGRGYQSHYGNRPVRALDHRNTDVTDAIRAVDRVYAGPYRPDPRFVGYAKEHFIDLDFVMRRTEESSRAIS